MRITKQQKAQTRFYNYKFILRNFTKSNDVISINTNYKYNAINN